MAKKLYLRSRETSPASARNWMPRPIWLGILIVVSSSCTIVGPEPEAAVGRADRFLDLETPGIRKWEAVTISESLVASGDLPADFSVEIRSKVTVEGKVYTPVINYYLPVNHMPDTLLLRTEGDFVLARLEPHQSGLDKAEEFLLYAFGNQQLTWEVPFLQPSINASYTLYNFVPPEGVESSDSLAWTTWSVGPLGRSHSTIYESFDLELGRTSIIHLAQAGGRTEWRLKR